MVVEAAMQRTGARLSTYIPTVTQKNSAQTATELLDRMAIPQLKISIGSSAVETSSGKSVSLYIDFVPATPQELNGMRMADVKTGEQKTM